jgi:hypothetical protein
MLSHRGVVEVSEMKALTSKAVFGCVESFTDFCA